MNNTSNPFDQARSHICLSINSLRDFEAAARSRLPGVPWDLSKLVACLEEVDGLLSSGLALKAWRHYEGFSVLSPATLLGRTVTKSKQLAAKAASKKGGRAKSAAKTAACKANFELARQARLRKAYAWVTNWEGFVEWRNLKKSISFYVWREAVSDDKTAASMRSKIREKTQQIEDLEKRLLVPQQLRYRVQRR